MRTIIVAAILLAAIAPASAQSVAPPGAAACSGCHALGVGSASIPPLSGQTPESIVTAMQAFRMGQRQATVMDRIAKGFSDEETRAIADWVGQKR